MIDTYIVREFIACQECGEHTLVERVLNDINYSIETYITCHKCLKAKTGQDVDVRTLYFLEKEEESE